MPITVKFDPTSNSQQAQVIPDVTKTSAGLMTPALLAQVIAGGGGVAEVACRECFAKLSPDQQDPELPWR